MKKLFLILILLIVFAFPVQGEVVFLAGDSATTNGGSSSVFAQLQSLFPTAVLQPVDMDLDSIVGSGGMGGASSLNWNTGNTPPSCDWDSVNLKDCPNIYLANTVIFCIGYNDMNVLSNYSSYPNGIATVLAAVESFMSAQLAVGREVYFVSSYPASLSINWGTYGDGTTAAAACATTGGPGCCADITSCKAIKNRNYHYFITQLKIWCEANGVVFLDFFHERIATDEPDDYFINANGTDGIHFLQGYNNGGQIMATFIMSRMGLNGGSKIYNSILNNININ
jgi:hypothetical protein